MKTSRTLAMAVTVVLTFAACALAAGDDSRIVDSIKRSHVFLTQLTNDSIRVQSDNGNVTLSGTASSEAHKALAEDIAQSTPGVMHVDDQIVVKRETAPNMSDAWIKAKVKTALLFHRSVSAGTTVDVQNGVVTLRGVADSAAARDLATEYAQDVDGVKRVDNEMTLTSKDGIKPATTQSIDDASITAQVKFALLNHHSTSALRTHVETTDGIVTVTGTAKNQAEIDLVTKLVRDIDGVKDVRNEMTVGG